jgi:hydrogenase expression/formation protein HypD
VLDFNDPEIGKALIHQIKDIAQGIDSVQIMEVCGTHTMAIGRFGIRKILPDSISLVSGPGCPVCVTPGGYIDNAIKAAQEQNAVIATFGDMVRVPGVSTSLEKARTEGVHVQVITSPLDIFNIEGDVLFCAVGFETTAGPIAGALKKAIDENRNNVSFYTSLKVIPPTLQLLCNDRDIQIDGFLLPGHVSTIIGAGAYEFLEIPSSISGFDMVDILDGILRIVTMIKEGRTGVENGYGRAVSKKGNTKAQELLSDLFEPCDEMWRGIGGLPGCSLRIRDEYKEYDAEFRYGLPAIEDSGMPEACSCGDVLKGIKTPDECALFAHTCLPESPVGPCMVSSEGSCAAFYKYERPSQ